MVKPSEHSQMLIYERWNLTGDLEIVRHLVSSCGANVNIKNNSGRTPLHWACQYVYTLMVHSSLLSSPVHFTTVS